MIELIIVTPTYNRKKKLSRLYKSLINQSDLSFTWLIIDDGSTDNTKDYIQTLIEKKDISIKYYYKSNGGKSRAINYASKLVSPHAFLLIVDSDDYLLKDAVSVVNLAINKYEAPNIGAIFFHYQFENGEKLVGKKKPLEIDIYSNRYQYNHLYGSHDGCIGYYSKIFEKYTYPEFRGENYVGPTVLQMDMATEFDTVFKPDVIGVAEYQPDGITMSGRKLRLKNPNGMIYYCKLKLNNNNSSFIKFKYAISMWPYLIKLNKSFTDSLNYFPKKFMGIISYFPGIILSYMWNKKS